jgi:hypothetical protein
LSAQPWKRPSGPGSTIVAPISARSSIAASTSASDSSSAMAKGPMYSRITPIRTPSRHFLLAYFQSGFSGLRPFENAVSSPFGSKPA